MSTEHKEMLSSRFTDQSQNDDPLIENIRDE